jgi:hypothetical protein
MADRSTLFNLPGSEHCPHVIGDHLCGLTFAELADLFRNRAELQPAQAERPLAFV